MTAPFGTRRNLCPVPAPYVASTGAQIKFVRSGTVSSSPDESQATRSNQQPGPSGGPASAYYWYTNFTGDGTNTASTGASSDLDVQFSDMECAAGLPYTLSFWSYYAPTSVRPSVLFRLAWLNAAGTQIGGEAKGPMAQIGSGSTTWVRVAQTLIAPANAVKATVQAWFYGMTSTGSQALRWTGIQYEQTDAVDTYFDGESTGAAWEGTAQQSTSILVTDAGGASLPWAHAAAM